VATRMSVFCLACLAGAFQRLVLVLGGDTPVAAMYFDRVVDGPS